jgi:hypothetical protein
VVSCMSGIGSSGSGLRGTGALPVGEQRMTAVLSAYDPGTEAARARPGASPDRLGGVVGSRTEPSRTEPSRTELRVGDGNMAAIERCTAPPLTERRLL